MKSSCCNAGAPAPRRPSYEGRGLKSDEMALDDASVGRPSYEGRGLKSGPAAVWQGYDGRPSYEGRGLKF